MVFAQKKETNFSSALRQEKLLRSKIRKKENFNLVNRKSLLIGKTVKH